MNKPAISIVLPTHNGRRFIDQSIKSVVNQTCQDWEMIIVNDASTDATPLRIDWWTKQDARILAVHLAQNRTLPDAERWLRACAATFTPGHRTTIGIIPRP